MRFVFLLSLVPAATAFLSARPALLQQSSSCPSRTSNTYRRCLVALSMMSEQQQSNSADEDEPPQELVLGDALDQQMSKLRSKYPTAEADYLAAARARAAAKPASREGDAGDDDWQQIAEEKRQQLGVDIDDWENSQKEAGNLDSQILLPDLPPGDGDDGEGDEPKLLLF